MLKKQRRNVLLAGCRLQRIGASEREALAERLGVGPRTH